MEPFASPHQIDPKLSSFLKEACENLCGWLASSGVKGPLPDQVDFPKVEPEKTGLSPEELLKDINLIMEGSYRPSHPGAIAHLDPPPLTASIVGDLICAGLNNNLLAEELSPSLSKLERDICLWFSQQFNLPKTAGGVAVSGGTLSNLMALVIARENANLQHDPSAVLFASADCHVSLSKAISVMGLKEDSLQLIPVDHNGKMSIQELKNAFENLRLRNRKCFAIVATAGTTVRGAIDPIRELSDFSKEKNLWLHVDGAIGGVFCMSQKTSHLLDGISRANSITINPQKLLGITKTSSLLIVSDRSQLSSTFSTGLPYFEPALEDDSHCGEIGLQGSRPAEVLKLWLGIRQLGEIGIQSLLNESISRRSYLESKLNLNLLNVKTGPLHLIAISLKDSSLLESDYWSNQTRNILLANNLMLSRPYYQGKYYLKVVLGNPNTRQSDLDLVASILNKSVSAYV